MNMFGDYKQWQRDEKPLNADPTKFEIHFRVDYGRYSLVLVKYDAGASFNGVRLLITKDLPKQPEAIVPDFLTNNEIIAMFRPDKAGQLLAHKIVLELADTPSEN